MPSDSDHPLPRVPSLRAKRSGVGEVLLMTGRRYHHCIGRGFRTDDGWTCEIISDGIFGSTTTELLRDAVSLVAYEPRAQAIAIRSNPHLVANNLHQRDALKAFLGSRFPGIDLEVL